MHEHTDTRCKRSSFAVQCLLSVRLRPATHHSIDRGAPLAQVAMIAIFAIFAAALVLEILARHFARERMAPGTTRRC